MKRIETCLHDVPEQLMGTNTKPAEHSPRRVTSVLALEDFRQSNVSKLPSYQSNLSRISNRMAELGTYNTTVQPDSKFPSTKHIETENTQLKRMLNAVREENNCLMFENQQLMRELEELQYEPSSFQTKISLLGSTLRSNTSSISIREDQIVDLEAEMKTCTNALRETEIKLEKSKKSVALNNKLLEKLNEELKTAKEELEVRSIQGKRAEQQRNEALCNAEKLTEAFKEYKADTAEKMKKLKEGESKLKESLIQCDKELEEFRRRCLELERERTEMGHRIQELKEVSNKAQLLTTENTKLQSRLEQSSTQISKLEWELAERTAEAARDTETLRRENAELRSHSDHQQQQLAQSQREIEESRTELASLEVILSRLHIHKDGEALCAKPCIFPNPSDLPAMNNSALSKPGEGYQRLLSVLQTLEQEKSQQQTLVAEVQAKLTKAYEEISTLQDSMAQRSAHLHHIHNELLEKASEAGRLEEEVKKKNIQLATLEKKLEENTSAYTKATVKSCELEQNLLEKNSCIEQLESLLKKKRREYKHTFNKIQQATTEQCKKFESQIELLHLSLDQKQAQVLELERLLGVVKQEKEKAQQNADLLQASVAKLTQENSILAQQNKDIVKNVKEQTAESYTKVKNLEKSLESCNAELNTCLQQMKEAKEKFEKELKLKSSELDALQAALRSNIQTSRTSSDQNQQLQCSLQHHQAMLLESNNRVAELEETQAQLERQVARLEQELEKERAATALELKKMEQVVQEAQTELWGKEQQTLEFSNAVTQMTLDMNKHQAELSTLEQELLQLRRDSGIKASQLSQMEETLQETQGLLEKKSEMVMDLEEKLHRSEMDRRNSLQHAQLLESQLQKVRGELADTLDHLQELRNVLQHTQISTEEREAAMEKLATELRESRRELEERTHEVLNLDTALKEGVCELQQKALQLSQLEVAIRDYKLKMERMIIHLQRALERAEIEVKEREKQVLFLSERLELARTQLQEKENQQKDTLEESQQLRLCHVQLQKATQELQEAHVHCESLAKDLHITGQLAHSKETEVRQLQQEVAAVEAHAAEREARMQATVTSLQMELEVLREKHNTEQLQEVTAQLKEAQSACNSLHADLQAREKILSDAKESLLIKESKVTQLQSKLSTYERAAELSNTSLHQKSLLHNLSPDSSVGCSEGTCLDLPESLGVTQQATTGPLNRSWHSLSRAVSTASSEASFNPFTYMADESLATDLTQAEPSGGTLMDLQEFINRRLGLQDEPYVRMASSGSDINEKQVTPKDKVSKILQNNKIQTL